MFSILASFRCLEEDVAITQTGEASFDVRAEWLGSNGAKAVEEKCGVDLRTARVEFERYVNLAVCRLTLQRLYDGVGLKRPAGTGKYGL